jgi:DNA-binding response OmpR family regulator
VQILKVAAIGERTMTPALHEAEISASRPRILCVDDDPEISRIWKIRLAPHGVEVLCAFSGREGFAAAVEAKPDLIILDQCMPDEDGSQVLGRLRSHSGTRNIPVLMLTGNEISAAKRQALGLGPDDYLMKPVAFAELLERIRSYVTLSRGMEPTARA